MTQITEFFTGQYKILAWFIAAIVVIYIPAWMIYLRCRKRKAEAFQKRNPLAAEVRIARSRMNDILTVHGVDGEVPVFFSRGTHMYFFLTPAKHSLSLSYHWTKSSVLAKLGAPVSHFENFDAESAEITVEVKPCKHYQLRYDHDQENYVFEKD